jgi:hypothetical protein
MDIKWIMRLCGGLLGCLALVLFVNLTLGSLCFAYVLHTVTGLTAPLWGNLVGGLFLGELTIPLTVIVWLLTICGAHVPFFHLS